MITRVFLFYTHLIKEDMDSMMVSTRREKEELVLDLYYKQNKNYRQIAQEARMSPRDIGEIVKKASNEKERQQHKSLSTQAYELFSKDKTPVQVAIILNIGEGQASQYYTEYLRLIQLGDVTQIYRELKGDVWYFVNLCKVAKSARMSIPQVINLLKIANNYLPSVEYRYDQLRREISGLEFVKRGAAKDFQNLNDQIINMGKTLDSIKLDCEKGMARLQVLQQERMKQEVLVKHFENNNEEYINIVKTIEDKVRNILSAVKVFLQLALLSLIESMRCDPDKYISLIYYDDNKSLSSTTRDNNDQHQHYPLYMHRQQPYQSPYYDYDIEDCKTILLDEAEKLYSSMAKKMVCELIKEIASKTPIISLPVLSLDHKKQSQKSFPV
jgi:hypothetical protein